jgi:hypothetical protein
VEHLHQPAQRVAGQLHRHLGPEVPDGDVEDGAQPLRGGVRLGQVVGDLERRGHRLRGGDVRLPGGEDELQRLAARRPELADELQAGRVVLHHHVHERHGEAGRVKLDRLGQSLRGGGGVVKLEPASVERGLAERELQGRMDVLGVVDEEDNPGFKQRIGGQTTRSRGRPLRRAGGHTSA